MTTELVGWAAAAILLLTISSQVYQQWRTRSTTGVSPWLFGGQLAASIGFTVYSVLVDNKVFVLTNALILLSAIVGQFLYWRNSRTAPAIVNTIADSVGIPVTPRKRARPRKASTASPTHKSR